MCSTGNRKAAVLPLPVWLETIKSTNFSFDGGTCLIQAAAGQCQGNGFDLNLGWFGVTQIGNGIQQFLSEAQFSEGIRASGFAN